MDLIVTGATGFLGREIVHQALDQGLDVLALGRNTARLQALAEKGARTQICGLAQIDDLRLPPSSTASALIHCAALSDLWGPRATFRATNVIGTRAAIRAARRWGVRRLVHISSPSVLFQLKDQLGLDETTPLPAKPINAYAESKALAEGEVRAAADLSPLILRPRGLYGKGDPSLLPRVVRRTGLPAKWRKVPRPLALAYARVLETVWMGEPPLTRYSMGLFAYSQTLDISKARNRLNWRPRIDFQEGLRLTFAEGAASLETRDD